MERSVEFEDRRRTLKIDDDKATNRNEHQDERHTVQQTKNERQRLSLYTTFCFE